MAAPFIYVPEQAAAAESAAQLKYHNPYFHTPSTGQSPFLPPSPLLYPSSPYLGPKDGGTDPNKNKKPFDPTAPAPWPQSGTAEQPIQNPAYKTSWVPLTARPRTTSWHTPPPGSPSSLPKAPSMLHAQSYLGANAAPAHKRSKSWGIANAPPAPIWAANANAHTTPDTLPPMQVHPWLNGDSPSPIFFFDLAPTAFAPQRAVTSALSTSQSQNKMHGVGLSGVEMRETAFHPPLTKCRILHPQLPFWPIDLALPEDLTAAQGQGPQQQPLPPISLGDVLAALHHALHVRIAPADWAALSPSEQANVGGAFTRRCREEAVRALGGEAAGLREREVEERNKGVKRVDFLLGKTVFKGLVRARGDPEGCVRVVTA
ncbi:hypothetical protein R3P38DRAFT_3280571 [Favolaschia claudopus]|uniref:DUF6699 domain-containing protein n=1 Tax=Favolaschia claudopus TaxID=2862362 RepID=A0AAW0AGQ8_9AGAR